MKKFIVFDNFEDCQKKCEELTVAYNKLELEPPTIYAEPFEGQGGWYIPITEYCKEIFTTEEINSAVDYIPLSEEETYEV